jgi:nucleoside-diphosphate-sugar epimerase
VRVFVAGATGAIGRPLVAQLLDGGHEVAALARSPDKAAALREGGVDAVVCDALDADGVRAAVVAARPEVVVHQLTQLPAALDMRRYAEALAPTNRLRRETGATFAAAARAVGARRLVVQSVAFMLRPEGPAVQDERAPLWLDAPGPMGEAVGALDTLERAALGAEGVEGVVLRYGFFYGPGTAYAPDGALAGEIRRRRFPIVGDGAARFAFVHVEDAARATVLALDRGSPGTFFVVDDEPAPAREWVPALAALLGAKRPLRIPVWVARLVAGPVAAGMAGLRGASNAKARTELGFQPRFATWREGFEAVFGSGGA